MEEEGKKGGQRAEGRGKREKELTRNLHSSFTI